MPKAVALLWSPEGRLEYDASARAPRTSCRRPALPYRCQADVCNRAAVRPRARGLPQGSGWAGSGSRRSGADSRDEAARSRSRGPDGPPSRRRPALVVSEQVRTYIERHHALRSARSTALCCSRAFLPASTRPCFLPASAPRPYLCRTRPPSFGQNGAELTKLAAGLQARRLCPRPPPPTSPRPRS